MAINPELDAITSSSKLVLTPGPVCGFHCQHCNGARDHGLVRQVAALTPEHIEMLAERFGQSIFEVVKFGGISGDFFLDGREAVWIR